VIEQTVRETLPEGFQRSEFLLEHGALDMIVSRKDMRARLHEILSILSQVEISGKDNSQADQITSQASTDESQE